MALWRSWLAAVAAEVAEFGPVRVAKVSVSCRTAAGQVAQLVRASA